MCVYKRSFLVQYSDSCLRELHRTKNNIHGTSEKHFQITDLCQLYLIFYCELGVLKDKLSVKFIMSQNIAVSMLFSMTQTPGFYLQLSTAWV